MAGLVPAILFSRAVPRGLFPSPLEGEGGEREARAGRGVCDSQSIRDPSPALARLSPPLGHPLPQGERGSESSARADYHLRIRQISPPFVPAEAGTQFLILQRRS